MMANRHQCVDIQYLLPSMQRQHAAGSASDKDNSLMIVSHYYEELQHLVDKILILDKGKVVAYGKKEDLFKEYCGNSVIIIDNIEKNSAICYN